MFVTVRASNPNHAGRWRAGRFFSNKESRRIEVVDDEKDPTGPDGRPHPDKMNRAAYELMMKDDRLSVKPEGADNAASKAEIEALQATIGSQAADLADAKAELALVTDENTKLVAANTELRAKMYELLARIAASVPAGDLADAKAEPKVKTEAKDAKADGKPAKG